MAERALAAVLDQEISLYPFRVPGRRYSSPRDIVRQLGQWYRPAPFPAELAGWRGAEGDCYAAAARLAAAANLTYVEGVADPGQVDSPAEPLGLALDHAGAIDDQGRVVDPTWSTPGAAYLGIAITLDYRTQTLARRSTGRTAVLDWTDSNLLTHGLPPDALTPGARPRPGEHQQQCGQ